MKLDTKVMLTQMCSLQHSIIHMFGGGGGGVKILLLLNNFVKHSKFKLTISYFYMDIAVTAVDLFIEQGGHVKLER